MQRTTTTTRRALDTADSNEYRDPNKYVVHTCMRLLSNNVFVQRSPCLWLGPWEDMVHTRGTTTTVAVSATTGRLIPGGQIDCCRRLAQCLNSECVGRGHTTDLKNVLDVMIDATLGEVSAAIWEECKNGGIPRSS